MSFDLPENEICAVVNEALWEIFVEAYLGKYRSRPSPSMWTEESVVQWFDRFMHSEDSVDYAD